MCSRTRSAGLAARSLGTCASLAEKDLCPIACDIFSHQRAIDYFRACAALNRMLCLAVKGEALWIGANSMLLVTSSLTSRSE